MSGAPLFGFALLRDRERRKIAFEGSRDETSDSNPWRLPFLQTFVIDEDNFEPESI